MTSYFVDMPPTPREQRLERWHAFVRRLGISVAIILVAWMIFMAGRYVEYWSMT